MENDEQIAWDDIEGAARKMFSVWSDGSELEWAKECWEHFAEAGLTGNFNPIVETTSKLRLVALAHIYEKFCGAAWDMNNDTPIEYLAEDIYLNPFALGYLTAQISPDMIDESEYHDEDDELKSQAISLIVDSLIKGIYNCLSSAYGGDHELYSRMYKTKFSVADEEDEDMSDDEEYDVTFQNAAAFEFVSNGFRE